jgi:tRNA nucleotidyltransferase (CCA-adding enzyme)
MQQTIEEITKQIRKKLTPSIVDRARMETLSKALELKVSAACKDAGVNAIVRLEGSAAKDTWLKSDLDIDIFIRLPTTIPRVLLDEVSLKIAKQATAGAKHIERFAEHPYLEVFIDDTRINIVPCYDTKLGEWLSATDRTPYHTDFIKKHLKPNQHNEVRVLKKFMKGVEVYGAEIKVGGFSGYLCELMVLAYGSFTNVLKAFADHLPKRIVDIEGYYKGREREVELLFPEPLVIIDPVDKGRNVASAVQPQKLHQFVAASRAFLKNPTQEFFYPLKTPPLNLADLHLNLKSRGPRLIFLTLNNIKAVPDILWGQLHRTRKALRKQLELSDFKVLRDTVWSDEKTSKTIFLFELEQLTLPNVKKHLGPPIELEKECEQFLTKHSQPEAFAGPFINEGRWIVLLPRKYTSAVKLLQAKINLGAKSSGVAELVAKALDEDYKVLVDEQISEYYALNEDFATFLTDFLSGKPFWLET